MFETEAAVREAFFGNASEDRKNGTAALAFSNARDVEYGVAFAAALSGDLTRSEPLANDLESRFPEDTCVNFTYMPVLRSLVLLPKGSSTGAIDQLQVSTPYELGDTMQLVWIFR